MGVVVIATVTMMMTLMMVTVMITAANVRGCRRRAERRPGFPYGDGGEAEDELVGNVVVMFWRKGEDASRHEDL